MTINDGAFESPDPSGPSRYPEHICMTSRKFLQGCEVDVFCKYCSICNKNHLKSQFEREKLHAECVLHHRNILTSRMITPFALADNYDPNDVRENL